MLLMLGQILWLKEKLGYIRKFGGMSVGGFCINSIIILFPLIFIIIIIICGGGVHETLALAMVVIFKVGLLWILLLYMT